MENGTEFRFGTRVKAVDTRPHTQPVVTLESGEQLKADVVIGADGLHSLVRKMIVDQDERTTYMGTDVFNVLIPGDRIVADPVAKSILDEVRRKPKSILTRIEVFGIGCTGTHALHFGQQAS